MFLVDDDDFFDKVMDDDFNINHIIRNISKQIPTLQGEPIQKVVKKKFTVKTPRSQREEQKPVVTITKPIDKEEDNSEDITEEE